ncbi:VanZ family protein [Larkinella terrae]|nr:VanZ family protein [Larkinella terrae]
MRIIYLLIALGVALVFYLSWRPSPMMEQVWFIPDWLGRWTDKQSNGDLRTAVPFVFLGGLTGLWLLQTKSPRLWWFFAFIGLTIVAVIAEVGQLMLPHRYFKWQDILWGSAGTVIGLISASLAWLVIKRFN